MISLLHVYEVRPRKDCRRNVPKRALLRDLSAESAYSRAAKLGDCLSARWLMKVHHSLATYRGGAADMNKRCAMWLPTFLQRSIHFFGKRTEVLAFNNFVLFDRVHLPIIGKRAAVVEEDLLSVREPVYSLFRPVCGAGLLISSWSVIVWRPAVSAAICFCSLARIAPCSSTLRCSLRNSLSNIAFTAS